MTVVTIYIHTYVYSHILYIHNINAYVEYTLSYNV